MRTTTWLGIAIAALLVAALLVLSVYAYKHIIITNPGLNDDLSGASGQSDVPTRITAFKVERPNLVLEGSNLSRVEIWAVPTGIGVSESNHYLLGTATLRSDSAAAAQVWTLPIPAEPVSATEIYAKGFDRDGAATARVSLPYTGATSIYYAVGGNPSGSGSGGSSTGSGQDTQRNFSFSLSVGQQRTVGSPTGKLVRITGDS